ncbi:MAG: serine/threonine protein kinase [Alphaproteobacteria bacterium]|nr:serine/threonine protein kinase [Alphaproteobacteria bacterium]
MAVTPSDAAPAVDAFELSGWIVLGCLASAGARAVLRCRRADDDGARFILKLLRPGATEAAKLRFEREAELLRRLRHPNLVPLVEAGQSPEGARYLILPELPGRPLSPGQLPPSGLLEVGRQIADVLATLHAAGVAHRDLKPENVLVDDLGQAALIDLGVAWVQGGARLTAAGQIPGTPWTLAPERLEGGDADPRPGDIYSLGLMLWQLWSGAPALQAMTPADLLAARRRGPLPALADAPEALSALLQAMTAPSPEARPSAAAVAEALSRLRGLVDDADRPGLLQTLDGSDAPPAAPQEPTQQLGRYVLQGELGRGGMGVVYRAWDPELQRQVALKTTSPGRRAERRFQREVRVVQDLDHPAIVRVLDVGEVDGTPYYAMELIEGPTLRALLTERGPLPPVEACACAAALAEGLTYAHARGVVHRDIKPENVLMEQGRLPRLLDFGLARRLDLESLAMTKTGELLGTPLYMAPEQVQGREADGRADVYSLGAVLYEMLCGLPPHPPDHPARLLYDILHVDPPRRASSETASRPRLDPHLPAGAGAGARGPVHLSMEAFVGTCAAGVGASGCLRRVDAGGGGAGRRRAAQRLVLAGGAALLGAARAGLSGWRPPRRGSGTPRSSCANLEAEVELATSSGRSADAGRGLRELRGAGRGAGHRRAEPGLAAAGGEARRAGRRPSS